MATQSKFTSLFSTDFYETKYATFGIKITNVQNGDKHSKFVNISKASRVWSSGERKTTWSNVCIPLVGWSAFMVAVATVDKQLPEQPTKGILSYI